MSGTIVVLVNGEVLAYGQNAKIPDQRHNAEVLAAGLLPILTCDLQVAILPGNKPQVGFVLFRSELSSHVLHTIPLDVCGADTQGATGYLLSQALRNALEAANCRRRVLTLITQTLVEVTPPDAPTELKTIGPAFDREKADQYRQTRGWTMVEEAGKGYRRAVPVYHSKELLEIESIRLPVEAGAIVIAAGGGGVPVARNAQGRLEGVEAVINTDEVACLLAAELHAQMLLMVIERDHKFLLSGLGTESPSHLSLGALDEILAHENFPSSTVYRKLKAASDFLHQGGEQVIITTLRKLPQTLAGTSGLRIGAKHPTLVDFDFAARTPNVEVADDA